MEDVLKMIFSAGNARTAVLLAAGACGFTWLHSKMDKRFSAQDERIRSLRDEIRELKTNDIAHLYAAIEALVFSMVKNKTLTETDQRYINERLHSTR
jgi:hypothetical protein